MSISKTRQKLVDVARQLFAKNGIANTTMNDIAVASGKGRRTLYTYFKSKEDIYYAVIESELERLSDKLDEVAARKMRPQDKIIELIYTHLNMIRETVVRNGNLRAEFFRNIWMVEKVRKNFDEYELELFRKIYKEAKDDGEFDIEDVELVADITHYCIKGLEVPFIYGRLGKGGVWRTEQKQHQIMRQSIETNKQKNHQRNMGLLQGKTALITGAARGIGKAIALKFAEEGANVAFTDLAINEETEQEIAAKGVKAKSYASNAADFAQTEEVVKAVKEEFGSIDILVNNAGITKDGLMLRMTEQQWDAVIAVNLKSAFNFIHACVPIMMRQRGGSIINMASVVGVHGNAGQANYAASKAGLIALAKSIGQEMGPKGIRANAIAPGFIDTAMTQALSDDIRKEWISKIPLRRGGTVEDIANTAVYLGSDLSSYVSGQVIQVDGGMNM